MGVEKPGIQLTRRTRADLGLELSLISPDICVLEVDDTSSLVFLQHLHRHTKYIHGNNTQIYDLYICITYTCAYEILHDNLVYRVNLPLATTCVFQCILYAL